ncbi:alpha/beta hydrolase [Vibrio parahaemolyticus]|nr:alpha/beta hydrolase [Vibrio parahaemolyticus]EJG0771662.1 alpha/beta hydrolase [Vibrio parahaemolyticus]EJG0804336.1 alpha/beta hydrolase [Vibrio parahaemolyticus]EJG0956118.1 alpha/beta hydrolase [Vibrio parahaemolyticus]EJG1008481.1 alpha/beta hydrolase [Vibrio parahaemolyticus]
MADLRLMFGNSLARKHVVFIHGLGGNAETTWQSNSSAKVFWPKWLHEDIEDTSIWSIGYDAPKLTIRNSGMGLLDRAQNILETILTEQNLSKGELILVGHSLGGLVIKQLLRLANDQRGREGAVEFVNRVTGVVFLGSPHTGADLAQVGNSLLGRLLLKLFLHQPSAATASLERNDATLRELNTWYRGWCHDKEIRHLVLVETKPYLIFGRIVKADSSDPGLKERAIPIDAHHINISKPSSKQDDIYKHIKKFVEEEILSRQACWLRANFGKDYSGWKEYGNWANCPKGVEEEYILDQAIRLYSSSSNDLEGIATVDALNLLRERLLKAGTSIRLVGLSGVGKTRFVQALFDERIEGIALDKETVFYTDISLSPSPTPRVLVERLVKYNLQAIVIVDNCAPDLHRELTNLCKGNSTVRILTVEYDVREDQPEQTEVYTLAPSSKELIETMVSSGFPYLSKQTVEKIADFSGGNARVANALASTVGQDENISRLKDEELFKRLFHQRHDSDINLEKAAEGLSLAYSFQLESEEDFSEELKLLGEIVKLAPNDMYKFAKDLKRRNLAQQRGIWMAILPHPIANRLARLALQNIPYSNITKYINSNTKPRLLKSFSRRLGYLNDSEEAVKLVTNWLEQDGVLDLLYNNGHEDLSISLLNNIAPITPNEVLIYLEGKASLNSDFLSRDNPNYIPITRLLRSLAYDDKLFEQSFDLLCHFALSEKKGENNNSVRSLLRSLFQLYLSGTHATLERRIKCIGKLIDSTNESERELAYELLDSALNTSHFSSSYGFDFGAKSRDFGYEPQSGNDVLSWYREYLLLIRNLATRSQVIEESLKDIFANHIRGLWSFPELHDDIEFITRHFCQNESWPRGWLALGSALRFDALSMKKEHKERLELLRTNIAAQDLDGQMKLYVLTDNHDFFGLDDINEEGETVKWGYHKAQEFAEELGTHVAKHHYNYLLGNLTQLLTKMSTNNHLFRFGHGVAKGVNDTGRVWTDIVSCLEKLNMQKVNSSFVGGFVRYVYDHDIDEAKRMLGYLLNDEKLSYIFPLVQFDCPLDETAVSRLIASLKKYTSPAWMYKNMAFGRRHESIPDSDLITLLDLLWLQPNGNNAVIEILTMRFHGLEANTSYLPSDDLIKKCREFLLKHDYSYDSRESGGRDYSITQIAKVCFRGDKACEDAHTLFQKLFEEISNYRCYAFNYGEFLSTVIELQPAQALDVFFKDENVLEQVKTSHLSRETSPFSNIPLCTAIKWCKESPKHRFKTLALSITPYEKKDKHLKLTNLAKALINESPEPSTVLEAFGVSTIPTSWGGSRALIIEQRAEIFEELLTHENPDVVESAQIILSKLEKRVEREKLEEELESRRSEERFE